MKEAKSFVSGMHLLQMNSASHSLTALSVELCIQSIDSWTQKHSRDLYLQICCYSLRACISFSSVRTWLRLRFSADTGFKTLVAGYLAMTRHTKASCLLYALTMLRVPNTPQDFLIQWIFAKHFMHISYLSLPVIFTGQGFWKAWRGKGDHKVAIWNRTMWTWPCRTTQSVGGGCPMFRHRRYWVSPTSLVQLNLVNSNTKGIGKLFELIRFQGLRLFYVMFSAAQ